MTPALIVSLGNPGPEHQHNRHNIGFRVLEKLHQDMTFAFSPWIQERDVSISLLKNRDIFLRIIKPLDFMNNSGTAVQRFVAFYKTPTSHLLVIHDDLDLAFGELRPAFDRGAAGHNGVTDIMEKLGTQKFHRLRIGIGSNREQNRPAEDYVLQDFTPDEESQLNLADGTIAKATDWVAGWIRSLPLLP